MKPKQKKCKVRGCKNTFTPYNSLQNVCSPACAIILAKKDRKKKEKECRKQTRAEKIALKTRGDWLKDLQKVFNLYIRLRDKNKPCISCQTYPKKSNAGHYLSVGARPELRFNEDNVHLQCEHCNSYLSGNQIEYRKNLIKKIGLEKVEWLEGPHELPRLTIDEIQEKLKHYRKKVREMK